MANWEKHDVRTSSSRTSGSSHVGRRQLADHDPRRRGRREPAEYAQELRPGKADAAVRGTARLDVKKDARSAAGYDRIHVELDDREIRIGTPVLRHVRRRRPERRATTAADPLEGVVRGGGGILDPPVAAAQAHVAELEAGIRLVAEHPGANREHPDRRRPVALAAVEPQSVSADTRAVRPGDGQPAGVDATPGAQRRIRAPPA